jgi:nitrous oxidase accessory protein NosD
MKRKWLAIGIILLFVGTCIIPAIAQDTEKPLPTSRGNWLYVGGSGPGNYTKIQDAIDNASNNDTVFVYKGLYNDYYPSGQFGYTVCVNKEIKLIGEDKNTTIINGTGNAITVKIAAPHVEVRGFTIQNGGGSFCGGIRIMDNYWNIRINKNIIRNNSAGVFLFLNRDADIRYNIIENNGNGIYSFDSSSDIMYNIISNNTNGIVIVYGNSDNMFFPPNNIVYNEIRDNSIGIQAENSQFLAQCNNFINNSKHTDISKGIYVSSIVLYVKMRNLWSRNYWDDWVKRLPRTVKGICIIAIHLPRTDIPILVVPYRETDFRPPTVPYDIWSKLNGG